MLSKVCHSRPRRARTRERDEARDARPSCVPLRESGTRASRDSSHRRFLRRRRRPGCLFFSFSPWFTLWLESHVLRGHLRSRAQKPRQALDEARRSALDSGDGSAELRRAESFHALLKKTVRQNGLSFETSLASRAQFGPNGPKKAGSHRTQPLARALALGRRRRWRLFK